MGEILLIAVVALLFLGPEKLPDAAKTLSKGIRDFRKQTRELQQIVEDDNEIGGAIRDIKSALRGEDPEAAERRRKAIAAARKAADNAAKAAEEMAEKRAAEEAAKAADGGDGDADAAAGKDADDADDADVATMLGMTDDEPPGGTAPAQGEGPAESGTGSDKGDEPAGEKPLYRPAASPIAYHPLFANQQSADGQPGETDGETDGDSDSEAGEDAS